MKKSPKAKRQTWKLMLYVAGTTPNSLMAYANLKKVCREYLEGQYTIQLIDLLKNPKLAKDDQIVAIPTLVRRLPVPLKKMIGDLSDKEKLLVGLNIVGKG